MVVFHESIVEADRGDGVTRGLSIESRMLASNTNIVPELSQTDASPHGTVIGFRSDARCPPPGFPQDAFRLTANAHFPHRAFPMFSGEPPLRIQLLAKAGNVALCFTHHTRVRRFRSSGTRAHRRRFASMLP
jgi:hypothetical protein